MSERDVRVVENMTRTGICFDDLCEAFAQFQYEDIEVIYRRMKLETIREALSEKKNQ